MSYLLSDFYTSQYPLFTPECDPYTELAGCELMEGRLINSLGNVIAYYPIQNRLIPESGEIIITPPPITPPPIMSIGMPPLPSVVEPGYQSTPEPAYLGLWCLVVAVVGLGNMLRWIIKIERSKRK